MPLDLCLGAEAAEMLSQQRSIARLDSLVFATLPLTVRTIGNGGAVELLGGQFLAGHDAPWSVGARRHF